MFEEIRKEGTRVENEGKQRAAEEGREGHDRNGDGKRKDWKGIKTSNQTWLK